MFNRIITGTLLVLSIGLFPLHLAAQTVIDSIITVGNDHTKRNTILRESQIKLGQEIPEDKLSETLQNSCNQLLSTGLFNNVEARIENQENQTCLIYNITENWYLYPFPLFELADRNFNVWWQEMKRDLSRTVYGVNVNHFNLTGQRDPINIKFHAGYTRKIELDYNLPILLGKTWGLAANLFYSDNKELGYKTVGNKTLFAKHPEEKLLLKRRRMGFRLLHRPNVFTYHSWRLEYHHNSVDPYVIESLNEEYFLDGREGIHFFFLEYDVQFDRRNYALYPQKGFLVGFNFKQEGLGIFNEYHNTGVFIQGEYYVPLISKITYGIQAKAKTNITRDKISYANNTGLGWDGYHVIGLDLYVLDGTDYLLVKNNINIEVFKGIWQLFSFLPKQFRTMPLSVYARVNFDTAYVNEPSYTKTNDLNNRWVFGYGPAIDLIFYNNFLFTFEYGFNDLGDHGLYLSKKFSF